MLEKLYELGYFNYQKFLLDNQVKLGIKSNDIIIFTKVLDNYPKTKKIKISEIKSQTGLSLNDIEKSLAKLMELDFYEIYIKYNEGIGEECIKVTPFFQKISELFTEKPTEIKELIKTDNEVNNHEVYAIIELLQSKLNRILTSLELEKVSVLSDEGVTYQDVLKAINSLNKKAKVISLKNIDIELASIFKQKYD